MSYLRTNYHGKSIDICSGSQATLESSEFGSIKICDGHEVLETSDNPITRDWVGGVELETPGPGRIVEISTRLDNFKKF